MNALKVSDVDYIQFLITAQRVYTCTKAARCAEVASRDAYTHLLSRLPPDTAALWQEVKPANDFSVAVFCYAAKRRHIVG